MIKLLLATGNPHKAAEIRPLLASQGLEVELKTLKDFPEIPEPIEDGRTLEENARKKAVGPAKASGLWTLADDTGLEVEALGGAPGVYSARYAGEDCDFAANIDKLLRALSGIGAARRGARFRCVLALASPLGEVHTEEGRLEGRIAERPSGAEGFGYDPVFFLPELGKSLAELPFAEKNRISHRARAIEAISPLLRTLVKEPA